MESESPEYTGTRQFFVVHSGYEDDFLVWVHLVLEIFWMVLRP